MNDRNSGRSSGRNENSSRGERSGGRNENSSRDDGGNAVSTRGSSRYNYTPRTVETTEKRKRMSGDRDYFVDNTYPQFKPKDNENCNRLLPPTWEKPDHWGYDVYVHYGYGPDKAAYLCLDKMKGEACPICEERDEAFAAGDREYADDLKWSHGLLTLVIDRDKEKDGPKWWTMPMKQIDGELLTRSKDKNSGEYIYIDDPNNGYDFDYIKEPKKGDTYAGYTGVDIARNPTPLGNNEQMDKWMKLVEDNPITSILVYHDYDHIAKVCGGKTPAADQDRGSNEESDQSSSTTSEETSSTRGPEIYSYEDIMEMPIKELDTLAFEKFNFKDEELSKLSDDQLREEMIKEIGCKKPEQKEESTDAGGRLAGMKDRFSERSNRP